MVDVNLQKTKKRKKMSSSKSTKVSIHQQSNFDNVTMAEEAESNDHLSEVGLLCAEKLDLLLSGYELFIEHGCVN